MDIGLQRASALEQHLPQTRRSRRTVRVHAAKHAGPTLVPAVPMWTLSARRHLSIYPEPTARVMARLLRQKRVQEHSRDQKHAE